MLERLGRRCADDARRHRRRGHADRRDLAAIDRRLPMAAERVGGPDPSSPPPSSPCSARRSARISGASLADRRARRSTDAAPGRPGTSSRSRSSAPAGPARSPRKRRSSAARQPASGPSPIRRWSTATARSASVGRVTVVWVFGDRAGRARSRRRGHGRGATWQRRRPDGRPDPRPAPRRRPRPTARAATPTVPRPSRSASCSTSPILIVSRPPRRRRRRPRRHVAQGRASLGAGRSPRARTLPTDREPRPEAVLDDVATDRRRSPRRAAAAGLDVGRHRGRRPRHRRRGDRRRPCSSVTFGWHDVALRSGCPSVAPRRWPSATTSAPPRRAEAAFGAAAGGQWRCSSPIGTGIAATVSSTGRAVIGATQPGRRDRPGDVVDPADPDRRGGHARAGVLGPRLADRYARRRGSSDRRPWTRPSRAPRRRRRRRRHPGLGRRHRDAGRRAGRRRHRGRPRGDRGRRRAQPSRAGAARPARGGDGHEVLLVPHRPRLLPWPRSVTTPGSLAPPARRTGAPGEGDDVSALTPLLGPSRLAGRPGRVGVRRVAATRLVRPSLIGCRWRRGRDGSSSPATASPAWVTESPRPDAQRLDRLQHRSRLRRHPRARRRRPHDDDR